MRTPDTLNDEPGVFDPALADRFYGVLADAGIQVDLRPLVPGEMPVGDPNIIQGTYDPRGEGETPPPPPPPPSDHLY